MQFESKIYTDLQEIPETVIYIWENQSGLAFDQTVDWYRLIYEHVLRDLLDARIIVISSTADGKPVAILPFAVTKDSALPLGIPGLRALTNYYSSVFDLIPLTSNLVTEIFDEVCSCIVDMRREARYIEVEPVPRDSRFFQEVSKLLAPRGYIMCPYRRFANWYHLTNGQSYDDYFSERESNIRNTFRRKEKKLQKMGYDIEIVQGMRTIEKAIEDYDSVYRRSWKGDESHPEFINALCRSFAASGRLRLGILRIDDRPIAAQIWFVYEGVASIYKLSYDEEFKSLSAGSVLTMALMKHVMDVDQVYKVDYLTGDDSYKRKYMNSSREMWSLRAYKKVSLAGVFGLFEAAKDLVRGSSE